MRRRYPYRRFDFGRDRFPNDFGGFEVERGLTFFTLPLIERRRVVAVPPSLRSLPCPDGFLRGEPPALAPGDRRRLPPRACLVFESPLNARSSWSSASTEWKG